MEQQSGRSVLSSPALPTLALACPDFVNDVALHAEIERAASVSGGKVDCLQSELVQLRRDAGQGDWDDRDDARSTMTAYERRKREELLVSLERKLKEISSTPGTTTAAPRFAFKKKPASTSPSTNLDSKADIDDGLINQAKTNRLIQRSNEYLSLAHLRGNMSTGSSDSVSLSGLTSSIIDLRTKDDTSIPSLYISDIQYSLVIAPKISGSVLIHNALNCVFVLGCHQFRIHSSQSTTIIFTNIESDPILEECEALRFGGVGLKDGRQIEINDFNAPSQVANPNARSDNWSFVIVASLSRIVGIVDDIPEGMTVSKEQLQTILERVKHVDEV